MITEIKNKTIQALIKSDKEQDDKIEYELVELYPTEYVVLCVNSGGDDEGAFESAVDFLGQNLNKIQLTEQPVYLYSKKSEQEILKDIQKLLEE